MRVGPVLTVRAKRTAKAPSGLGNRLDAPSPATDLGFQAGLHPNPPLSKSCVNADGSEECCSAKKASPASLNRL